MDDYTANPAYILLLISGLTLVALILVTMIFKPTL